MSSSSNGLRKNCCVHVLPANRWLYPAQAQPALAQRVTAFVMAPFGLRAERGKVLKIRAPAKPRARAAPCSETFDIQQPIPVDASMKQSTPIHQLLGCDIYLCT